MNETKEATPDTFQSIFDFFNAAVVDIDCGQKCKHLNGGTPVCCDTQNAVPIVQVAEWLALKQRTKMWRSFKPRCAVTRDIVANLHSSCKAVECRGAQHCERDNRSLSCRTFPFFPYFTNKDELIGLAYFWHFEDRCWVISNLSQVTPAFVHQFLAAYEILFDADPAEREVAQNFSATMRRVFSRWDRPFAIIDRDGGYLMVQPKGAGIHKIDAEALPRFEPYAD